MKFGLILIYNWIIGLVLFPIMAVTLYIVCRIKFGKDVINKFLKTNNSNDDSKDLWYSAIITFLWIFTIPGICYTSYKEMKEIFETIKSQKIQTL